MILSKFSCLQFYLRSFSFVFGPIRLSVKLPEQHQHVDHNKRLQERHSDRRVPVPDHIGGLCHAQTELDHLHHGQVLLPWARNAQLREEVVSVHNNMYQGVYAGSEPRIAPTLYLAHIQPCPHHEHVVVTMQEGDLHETTMLGSNPLDRGHDKEYCGRVIVTCQCVCIRCFVNHWDTLRIPVVLYPWLECGIHSYVRTPLANLSPHTGQCPDNTECASTVQQNVHGRNVRGQEEIYGTVINGVPVRALQHTCRSFLRRSIQAVSRSSTYLLL